MKVQRTVAASKVFAMAYGGNVASLYDWRDPSDTRNPMDNPYNFSDYWLIRPPQGLHYDSSYSDRMHEWDSAKYNQALQESGWSAMQTNPTPASLRKMVQVYFGPRAKLVGFARSCNQSTGYPLGVFATVTEKG